MSHLRALVPSFRFILICKFVFIQLSIQQSLNPDCNFIILHNRVESLNHFGLFLCHVGLFLRHIGLFVMSRWALCYVTLGSLSHNLGRLISMFDLTELLNAGNLFLAKGTGASSYFLLGWRLSRLLDWPSNQSHKNIFFFFGFFWRQRRHFQRRGKAARRQLVERRFVCRWKVRSYIY